MRSLAALVWVRDASSCNPRRERPHHPTVRATIHCFGRRWQPLVPSGRWTIARRMVRQGRRAHSPGLPVVARGPPDSAASPGVPDWPRAILAPAPHGVADHRPRGDVMGQQTPRTPRQRSKIALRSSRLGSGSGRPPGLAAGTRWVLKSHACALRPGGGGCRGAMPRGEPLVLQW